MAHYQYLIVGAGMTADAAADGIRQVDPAGSIGLIGAEPHPPYNRPPLSKALWKGKSLESIWRHTDRRGVDAHLGRTVRVLDAAQKCVIDDQGTAYTWEKLLLATGGAPRELLFGHSRIIYYCLFRIRITPRRPAPRRRDHVVRKRYRPPVRGGIGHPAHAREADLFTYGPRRPNASPRARSIGTFI